MEQLDSILAVGQYGIYKQFLIGSLFRLLQSKVLWSLKMTSEHKIQNDIRVALSKHQCTVFRVNVGSVKTPDGRFFSAGVPSGHPDLYGFRWSDHQVFYIEVKNEKGKPRADQIRFHEMLTKREIIHGIARSAGDAIKIVKEGLIGYGFPKEDWQ